MIAIYRGERVAVVRVQGRHTLIVWRGKLRRVQEKDLIVDSAIADNRAHQVATPDSAMSAGTTRTDDARRPRSPEVTMLERSI